MRVDLRIVKKIGLIVLILIFVVTSIYLLWTFYKALTTHSSVEIVSNHVIYPHPNQPVGGYVELRNTGDYPLYICDALLTDEMFITRMAIGIDYSEIKPGETRNFSFYDRPTSRPHGADYFSASRLDEVDYIIVECHSDRPTIIVIFQGLLMSGPGGAHSNLTLLNKTIVT